MGCIEAEREVEDLTSIPMTNMIYEYLDKIGGFSDESVLSFDDWMKFIESLIEYSSKPPLTTLTFQNPPEVFKVKT